MNLSSAVASIFLVSHFFFLVFDQIQKYKLLYARNTFTITRQNDSNYVIPNNEAIGSREFYREKLSYCRRRVDLRGSYNELVLFRNIRSKPILNSISNIVPNVDVRANKLQVIKTKKKIIAAYDADVCVENIKFESFLFSFIHFFAMPFIQLANKNFLVNRFSDDVDPFSMSIMNLYEYIRCSYVRRTSKAKETE